MSKGMTFIVLGVAIAFEGSLKISAYIIYFMFFLKKSTCHPLKARKIIWDPNNKKKTKKIGDH